MSDPWPCYLDPMLDRISAVWPDRGVILLLRHSVREPIRHMADAMTAPLTDEGRALARELGRRLGGARPGGARPARFYHSPVPRCIDTARRMVEGIAERGGRSETLGTREYLAAPYMRDPARAMGLFVELGGVGFARSWCRGELEEAVIQDHRDAGRALLNDLLDEHQGSEPGTLDIHVTHDLTVAALLSLVYPVGDPDFPWPDYLDGAVLAAEDDALTLCYRGASRVLTEREDV